MDIYERLDDMNADTAEARAAYILHGLGFTPQMQIKKTKDFSGRFIKRMTKNVLVERVHQLMKFQVVGECVLR